MTIQWDASAKVSQDEISGYRVYLYDADSETQELIAELPSTKFVYTDTSVEAGSAPSYIVTALSNTKESGASFSVSVGVVD